MDHIKNDPVKLREFCSDLSANAEFWNSTLKNIESGLAHLGESWRDDQFQDFRNQVYSVLRSIEGFSEDAKKTITELENDADAIEKIQNVRF